MLISKNISSSWKLLISILVCEAVGFASGLLSMIEANPWFDKLNAPLWNIPTYLFSPIWTFLYFIIGVSFWLIWRSNADALLKRNAQLLFFLQLFFNFLWSVLFFRFHSPLLALVDVSLLTIVTLTTVLYFIRISQVAALLLIPYLSWISFASVLNYTIWILNR
jgi:benzodiazapine receptor